MWNILAGSVDCRPYPHPRLPQTSMRCVSTTVSTNCIFYGWLLLILIYLLSVLLQIYLHNSQYPAILQDHSRTLAAPYKELRHHRSPCESIGNNYSPRGQNLKITHLHQRHHSLHCPSTPRILNKCEDSHTQACLKG